MDNSLGDIVYGMFALVTEGKYDSENVDRLVYNNGYTYRKYKSCYDVMHVFTKANDYYRTSIYNRLTEEKYNYMLKRLEKDCLLRKKAYTVGDVVKIVDFPPEGSGFTICKNPLDSEMGKWLGKVMTIKDVQSRCYTMKEDNGKWAWTDKLIEKKVN